MTTLKEQIEEYDNTLTAIKTAEPHLPKESQTCRYSLVDGAILMFIPYNLSVFYTYRDYLLDIGFEIDNKADDLNKYGLKENKDSSSDTLRLVHSLSKFKLIIILELRHPKIPELKSYVYSGPMPEVKL